MSVLSIQTRRIDGLTEATTAEDEDLLLIRKADGTGTRNIKKKNLVPETGVGNIKELETKDKTSVVKAVNELNEAIGDLSMFGSNNHGNGRSLVSLATREFYSQKRTSDSLLSKINTLNLKVSEITGDGAGFHNSLYGGKFLGDGLTEERVQAIRDGDFGDLFIGDRIGDFVIAHFDYFYRRFSAASDVFFKHHIVLIPLYANGGTYQYGLRGEEKCYAYSPIRSQGEKNYNIQSVLKNAKLYDQEYLIENTLSKEAETNRRAIFNASYKTRVECMSAKMVFGTDFSCGPGYHFTSTSETQFAIFRLLPEHIAVDRPYWLSNSYDETNSLYVDGKGNVYFMARDRYLYLRPYFVIG